MAKRKSRENTVDGEVCYSTASIYVKTVAWLMLSRTVV